MIQLYKNLNRAYIKHLPQACWYGICAPWGSISSLDTLVARIHVAINTLTGFAALVAVILIVYGGITFIMAAGDPDKIDRGSRILTNSVIGLIIVFIAGLLIRFVIDRFVP